MMVVNAVSGVIDHALIGLLRGDVQFGRNTLFAVGKLLALVVVAGLPLENRALLLYATWLLGNLVSFVAIVPMSGIGRLPWSAYRPQFDNFRRLGSSALQHHALNLSLQIPSSVLPVLVTVLLTATANAYFYVASILAGMVFVVPLALSTTLYAVSSHAPAALVSRTRLTLALSIGAGICANVLVAFMARPVLGLIGRAYVDEVEWVLRALLIAAFPIAIKMHFIALCQIKRRVGRAALVVSVAGVLEIAGAALGGRLGDLHGLAIGYVGVMCAEGLLLTPVVIRLLSTHRSPTEYLAVPTARPAIGAQAVGQETLDLVP
jgi:O-antigen/teichoic acid export membrane protein